MLRERRMRRAAVGAGAWPRPGEVSRGGAGGSLSCFSSSCSRLPVLLVPPPVPCGSGCPRGLPRPWLVGPRGFAEPWRSEGWRSAGLAKRRRRRRAPSTSGNFWKVPGARGGGSGGDVALASDGVRSGCRCLSLLRAPAPSRAGFGAAGPGPSRCVWSEAAPAPRGPEWGTGPFPSSPARGNTRGFMSVCVCVIPLPARLKYRKCKWQKAQWAVEVLAL